jgi:hypothetical protein
VDRERCVVRQGRYRLGGPRWAATRRNLEDSNGQVGTTNVEVRGRFAAVGLGRETAGLGFHTAEAAGVRESLVRP